MAATRHRDVADNKDNKESAGTTDIAVYGDTVRLPLAMFLQRSLRLSGNIVTLFPP